MNTLGTALPDEMDRVIDLLVEYVRFGGQGAFGVRMLRDSLRRATDAYRSDDVVAMLRAYEELKTCK